MTIQDVSLDLIKWSDFNNPLGTVQNVTEKSFFGYTFLQLPKIYLMLFTVLFNFKLKPVDIYISFTIFFLE